MSLNLSKFSRVRDYFKKFKHLTFVKGSVRLINTFAVAKTELCFLLYQHSKIKKLIKIRINSFSNDQLKFHFHFSKNENLKTKINQGLFVHSIVWIEVHGVFIKFV